VSDAVRKLIIDLFPVAVTVATAAFGIGLAAGVSPRKALSLAVPMALVLWFCGGFLLVSLKRFAEVRTTGR
jgi:hypothetical protein